MEHPNEQLPETEHVISDIDRINTALSHYGLYDASSDVYPTTDHDDESWCLEGLE